MDVCGIIARPASKVQRQCSTMLPTDYPCPFCSIVAGHFADVATNSDDVVLRTSAQRPLLLHHINGRTTRAMCWSSRMNIMRISTCFLRIWLSLSRKRSVQSCARAEGGLQLSGGIHTPAQRTCWWTGCVALSCTRLPSIRQAMGSTARTGRPSTLLIGWCRRDAIRAALNTE